MKTGDYSEYHGFSVEVESGNLMIVSDDTGDTHEVGDAVDQEHAIELVQDAIQSFAYGIAKKLVEGLE